MRKFLYEFVYNLMSFLLVLTVMFILVFLLYLFILYLYKPSIVAWVCLSLIIVIMALIPILFEAEPYIDKFAKLITGYNEKGKKGSI